MHAVSEFLANEQRVYAKFRANQETAKCYGLLPDPAMQQRIGGLAVAVRHPELAATRLLPITDRISRLIPCYAYDQHTEHATVCVAAIEGFVYNPGEHQAMLDQLHGEVAAAVVAITHAQRRECTVAYEWPLYSRTTVIIPGRAQPAYVDLLLTIADRCRHISGAQASWGTHITIARVSQPVLPERAASFFQYLDGEISEPVGNSTLNTIDIVWLQWRDGHLQVTTAYRCIV